MGLAYLKKHAERLVEYKQNLHLVIINLHERNDS